MVFGFPLSYAPCERDKHAAFLPCSQGIFMQARLQTARVRLKFPSRSMSFTREKRKKRKLG